MRYNNVLFEIFWWCWRTGRLLDCQPFPMDGGAVMFKILVSDALSDEGLKILRDVKEFSVDVKTE
jgi:hypothetical protein